MLEIYSLLNPKVANYNGTGGIPSLTPEDVSASLALIPITGPALLVRTMSGDLSSLRPLQQAFRHHVAHMAMLKHWKNGPKYNDYFEGLCEAVLHFYLVPNICGRCKGRGEVKQRDGRILKCPVCDGAGRRDADDKAKARAAGIPISFWMDTWSDRYTMAWDLLTAWDGQADDSARRVFWNDV
ncbi:MAG TPA: hypothetical protein VMV80_03825 [Anaerolineales bacterium]|nr:hypothetical protein [Anaerolineales bacterium]